MKSKLVCFTVLCFAVAVSGCSVMQPINGGASVWRASIEAGDTVHVETTDGRTLDFEVSEVTDEGLRGEGQAISYEAISSLRKKIFSTGRTVGLVAGIVAVGALIAGGGSGGGSGSGGGGGY